MTRGFLQGENRKCTGRSQEEKRYPESRQSARDTYLGPFWPEMVKDNQRIAGSAP